MEPLANVREVLAVFLFRQRMGENRLTDFQTIPDLTQLIDALWNAGVLHSRGDFAETSNRRTGTEATNFEEWELNRPIGEQVAYALMVPDVYEMVESQYDLIDDYSQLSTVIQTGFNEWLRTMLPEFGRQAQQARRNR